MITETLQIPLGKIRLEGDLDLPDRATGLVLFAHGSGSSRHSPRNKYVAEQLRARGIGTLLFDLLTQEEERVDVTTRHLRFDTRLLSDRLLATAEWITAGSETHHLPLGIFGASTGAAAALIAAARLPRKVAAVVSRGGRPDMANDFLSLVRCPVLLIVGELDVPVIELNEKALRAMKCRKEMRIVCGASHLFEERGALESVARHAADWFGKLLHVKD